MSAGGGQLSSRSLPAATGHRSKTPSPRNWPLSHRQRALGPQVLPPGPPSPWPAWKPPAHLHPPTRLELRGQGRGSILMPKAGLRALRSP